MFLTLLVTMKKAEKETDDGGKASRKSVLEATESGSFTEHTAETTPRRGFVSGFVASAGAMLASKFGLTRVSAASEQVRREQAKRAAAKYSSERQVERAVRKSAGELVSHLAKEGYLEAGLPSELPTSAIYTDSFEDYFSASDGVLVLGSVNGGEAEVKIQIKITVDDETRLYLVVAPQLNHSHAVVVNEATGEKRSFTQGTQSDDVTIQECTCIGDPTTWCELDCISGRCQCLQFNDGSNCNDDSGADCTKCYTEQNCITSCENIDKTCPS